jgi:ceramide glucosyltransferase
VLRPVRGFDQLDELTLGSSFKLAYPSFELIFCAQTATDPAVPLIKRLIADNPHVDARLLIGDDRSTANPKLNNLIKGWRAARNQWIVIADSNVLMPPDYLTRLVFSWQSSTGLICSPPIGSMPRGFWAEVECAFLNTYQARWQYAADSIGFGFAQGKTMLVRRSDLAAVGGIKALGSEIAEDAAATKIVREQGLRVALVDRPFEQPLGYRSARHVWDRQVRWARLRRVTFPAYFVPELLTSSFFPLLAGAYAAGSIGLDPVSVVCGLALLWFGTEAVLAKSAGWHLTMWSPLAWIARDLALIPLWVEAWLGNHITWRGNEMRVAGRRSNEPKSVHGY